MNPKILENWIIGTFGNNNPTLDGKFMKESEERFQFHFEDEFDYDSNNP